METASSSLTAYPGAVVDTGAFRDNLRAVRSYVGSRVRIMAVIKANGYGHGMLALAHEAAEEGIGDFGVARVHEGTELRADGFGQRTLVFEAARGQSIDQALRDELTLTVVTEPMLQEVEAAARRLGKKATIHIKVDTGMGRLGLPARDAATLITRAARSSVVSLEGVYSHFATSEDPNLTFAANQIAEFQNLLETLTRGGIEVPVRHMANSGAIIGHPSAHFDMVRPGIMLYGYPPRRGMPEQYPVRPVLSLYSTVAFLKTVGAGTSISYGRRYLTGRRTTIATVPLGYGDGYPRLLTGKGEALIRGRRYPVVGTVCMDQIMVDLGPESDTQLGDEVVLIGTSGSEQITAWDIAERTGSIPYEVTCVLTPRVPRTYRICR